MAAEFVDVLARQNLTIKGVLIPVYEVATVELTDEVQALIDGQALVPRGADGNFADLGPVWPIPTPPGQSCCGRKYGA